MKAKNKDFIDGLSSGFYIIFEDQLFLPMRDLLNTILQGNSMPDSWKDASISLIPKEGQAFTPVKNYRPIFLLNNDFKLFTSILAERLKQVLRDYTHEDWCGFSTQKTTKR